MRTKECGKGWHSSCLRSCVCECHERHDMHLAVERYEFPPTIERFRALKAEEVSIMEGALPIPDPKPSVPPIRPVTMCWDCSNDTTKVIRIKGSRELPFMVCQIHFTQYIQTEQIEIWGGLHPLYRPRFMRTWGPDGDERWASKNNPFGYPPSGLLSPEQHLRRRNDLFSRLEPAFEILETMTPLPPPPPRWLTVEFDL